MRSTTVLLWTLALTSSGCNDASAEAKPAEACAAGRCERKADADLLMASGVAWADDLDEALARARKEKKPIHLAVAVRENGDGLQREV